MIGLLLAAGERVVTIGKAPFVVGAGLVAAFVWVWFRLRRLRRRRERLLRLKASWGRPAEEARDFETLREFHLVNPSGVYPSGVHPLGAGDAVVDDATWRDLNMDAIYAMVDRTCSTPGGCMLYQVLRRPVMSTETLARRGELIGLFTNDPATREALQMELLGVGKSNARGLIALIFNKRTVEMMSRWMAIGLTLLAAACLAGALLTGQRVLTMGVFVLFVTNMGIHSRAKSQLLGRLDALRQLGGMITAAERIGRLEHPQMAEFIQPLREAASQTARIARNVSMLLPEGSSSGDLAAMVLEYVSIYFLHEVRTFQAVMTDVASRRDALRTIFGRIGELDAWQSVASFRAGLGAYCEPVFAEDGPRLEVRDARHPLLGEAVANSIAIEARGVAITGSNMSGKTTFLRTVGVNVLLAQTIYTCRAAAYRGRFMRVIASMDESDDLLEGKSYYLVEAERLLKIVKESERPGLVLALIDEPLAGTNSPQRLAASREILHYLVSHNALAMVCTHDVELVSQLQTRGDFEACHFSDLADETGIHFDYLLRQGLDYHGNAIRVLKHLGYPEAILAGAMQDLEGAAKE